MVLLAHYDTVRDSPGANDNTASVAVLLALAPALAAARFRDDVTVLLTDLEELGFHGATAYVAADGARCRLAVNLETVGYTCAEPGSQRLPPGLDLLVPAQVDRIRAGGMRGDFTAVLHDGGGRPAAAVLGAALGRFTDGPPAVLLRDPGSLPLVGGTLRRRVRAVRHFSRSDHVPFWRAGVPAVQLTDTADHRSPHYHRPTDTADRLDYERLAGIATATAYLVAVTAGLQSPG